MADKTVILFDGVCNFCNDSVNFIIKRDPASRFHFASLQSIAGRELLQAHGLPADHMDSLVLIEDGHHHLRSDAAMRIARHLSGLWPFFYYLALITPRFFRNWVYDLVAANRYRFFGKKDACMMPTPEIRARFLDNGQLPVEA